MVLNQNLHHNEMPIGVDHFTSLKLLVAVASASQ
jgi:hypothetical protein